MIEIRRYHPDDWVQLWPIMKPVFERGETYPYPMDISEEQAQKTWTQPPMTTFVAINERKKVVGTYYIKPNQPGLGSHVCNCGYIVANESIRQGIGTKLCEHSQEEARKLGFRSMQFNLVVSKNAGAVHLWKKLGFQVIGTLPRSFHYRNRTYVDALVMYKQLV